MIKKKGAAKEMHARIRESNRMAKPCSMAHMEGRNLFSCGNGSVGSVIDSSRSPLLGQKC